MFAAVECESEKSEKAGNKQAESIEATKANRNKLIQELTTISFIEWEKEHIDNEKDENGGQEKTASNTSKSATQKAAAIRDKNSTQTAVSSPDNTRDISARNVPNPEWVNG